MICNFNVVGRFLLSVIHPRTANLGEMSSPLLGAQLSLAVAGYELLYPTLVLNREHLVEGFSLCVQASCKTDYNPTPSIVTLSCDGVLSFL